MQTLDLAIVWSWVILRIQLQLMIICWFVFLIFVFEYIPQVHLYGVYLKLQNKLITTFSFDLMLYPASYYRLTKLANKYLFSQTILNRILCHNYSININWFIAIVFNYSKRSITFNSLVRVHINKLLNEQEINNLPAVFDFVNTTNSTTILFNAYDANWLKAFEQIQTANPTAIYTTYSIYFINDLANSFYADLIIGGSCLI